MSEHETRKSTLGCVKVSEKEKATMRRRWKEGRRGDECFSEWVRRRLMS